MPIFDKLKKLFLGRNSAPLAKTSIQLPHELGQVPPRNSEGNLPQFSENQFASAEPFVERAALSINESPVFGNAFEASLRSAVIEIDTSSSQLHSSRELLKEATVLKKLKKFDAACEKLREAYAADGSENLMIEERMRLPMYLQLAGRGDDGWDELNRLNAIYTDEFSQPIIANQMRVFQKKEGKERVVVPVPERAQSNSSERQTIGDLQTQPLSAWGDGSLISGLEFHATMQLRTPLRVLMRHGELHTDPSTPPPIIVDSPWEGVWSAKLKTWGELGIDLEEMSESTAASDIGQVLPSQFVPFLIAVKQNLEGDSLTMDEKISRLIELSKVPEFSGFIEAYGGSEKLIHRLWQIDHKP